MIEKPYDWETADAYTGDFRTLPAGGYVCRVVSAKQVETKSGALQLAVAFDIAEGEYAGFFRDKYESRKKTNPDAEWPNDGVYRQSIYNSEGGTNGFFKGMITNMQEDNDGFLWDWNENSLKGLMFGGLFQREEYLSTAGKSRWSTKGLRVVPVKGVTELPAPEDKPLKSGADEFVDGFDAPF